MCKMYGIISDLCSGKGITVGRMCSELSISRGTMGDLKAGRTKKLSAENLRKISNYFNVSTDYLLGAEKSQIDKDQELAELLEELSTRDECRMLFQLARDATPEEVRQAVKVIEALRK